jgi:hypothetical protein
MTNAERAAKNGVQSLTGGPIARATSQLPAGAGLASVAPVVAGQAQQPAQPVSQPQSLADAGPKQTSFDASNTAPKYLPQQPQSLASLAPASPSAPPTITPAPSQPNDLASLAPGGAQAPTAATVQQPVGLDSAFRSTGIGIGSNAIAGRIGAGGVPEFSNAPADLASAGGVAPAGNGTKMPTSLADLSPGGVSANPDAPLSSLGSAANLNDGVGTFSQAQAGDGQLAMTRFNRAADLRDAYKAQDQLQAAQAAQTRDRNFTVVHDSSQPVTRREIKFDQDRAATTQSLADAVDNAQTGIATQRQGVALDQQQRQANRLEDAFAAATAPNATPEQKQAYQNLSDPTGANALARRQAEAKIAETQANTQKITGEANGTTPEAQQKAQAANNKAQLDQLEIQRRQGVAAQTAKSIVDQKAGSIDVAREARDLANSIAGDKSFSSIVGPYDARTPTLLGGSQDLVNKANRLQSLLTLDNLKLMSGVLTDKDIEFLGRIGSGLNVTENGIKGSEQGTKDRLKEITERLTGKISDYDKANPKPAASPSQPANSSPSSAPAVGAIQQGYVFLGGDPASQSSWRKQ